MALTLVTGDTGQGVRGRVFWTDWLQRNYRRTPSAA